MVLEGRITAEQATIAATSFVMLILGENIHLPGNEAINEQVVLILVCIQLRMTMILQLHKLSA